MRSFDIIGARKNLKNRRDELKREREKLFYKAAADSKDIIKMIINDYNPKRICQWDSLLEIKMFTDYSDIDIALEGIGSIKEIIELEKRAEGMTEFSLDIVELEKIPSEYSEIIRSKGKLIHERN